MRFRLHASWASWSVAAASWGWAARRPHDSQHHLPPCLPFGGALQLANIPTALSGVLLLGLALGAGYMHTAWLSPYRCEVPRLACVSNSTLEAKGTVCFLHAPHTMDASMLMWLPFEFPACPARRVRPHMATGMLAWKHEKHGFVLLCLPLPQARGARADALGLGCPAARGQARAQRPLRLQRNW